MYYVERKQLKLIVRRKREDQWRWDTPIQELTSIRFVTPIFWNKETVFCKDHFKGNFMSVKNILVVD